MNSIVHFEIPVDNDEGKAFYQQVFDWKLDDMPMEDGSIYTTASTTPSDETGMPKQPGAINGGIFVKNGDDTLSSPVITINVDSIDDALEKIKAAGGEAYGQRGTVPGMGDYAYFTDPSGNVLGLWQNA
jgi:hypothetical protein